MRRLNLLGLWVAAWGTLCLFLTGCGHAPDATAFRWDALTPVSTLAAWDQLTPVWDNRVQSAVDVRLYLESYCQTAVCRDYVRETVPYFTALTTARVRLYDYPLSQVAESFMVAGIGHCVSRDAPERYLAYLKEAAASPAIKDELEMVRISKLVAGSYDSDCLRGEIKKIKPLFENNNPLALASVPATAVNGRLMYGSLSATQAATLMTAASQGAGSPP